MADCKVSVVCTAYNHEKYLRDALESFVGQETDFPFEVLVNDDASTDGTAAILREYAERYPAIIRPFYQEKNIFSRGGNIYDEVFYPVARGEYIAACEGDDRWTDPHKLQRTPPACTTPWPTPWAAGSRTACSSSRAETGISSLNRPCWACPTPTTPAPSWRGGSSS